MKSSFEELLRDLQIISKELFLSSWNLVSTTNLNTAFAFGGASLWNLPPLAMAFAGIWNVGGAGWDGVLAGQQQKAVDKVGGEVDAAQLRHAGLHGVVGVIQHIGKQTAQRYPRQGERLW